MDDEQIPNESPQTKSRSFLLVLSIIILGTIVGAYFVLQKKPGRESIQQTQQVLTTNMKLTSSVFESSQSIPVKYTCDGDNVSPPLTVSEVPQDAVSLALIMDDPDAPAGTWVHWIIFNIDPKTNQINENSMPSGSQGGVTSFGKPGYGGPCPPSGTHRYFFKLYALDLKLDLITGVDKAAVENAMSGHIISQVELVGTYSRKK